MKNKKTMLDEIESVEKAIKRNRQLDYQHEEIIIPRKYKSKHEAKYEILNIEEE